MSAINRYYSNERYDSREKFLAKGIKCVFISYQKDDSTQARKVADYLKDADIEVYFDEYDKELRIHRQSNKPQEVTKSILTGINNSSDMLVIVSLTTMKSNWVPFEIGFGYDKTTLSVLCLAGIPKGGLPEYLRTVPIIRDIYDLNNRIGTMKNKETKLLVETRILSDFNYSYNPLKNVMDSLIVDKY